MDIRKEVERREKMIFDDGIDLWAREYCIDELEGISNCSFHETHVDQNVLNSRVWEDTELGGVHLEQIYTRVCCLPVRSGAHHC